MKNSVNFRRVNGPGSIPLLASTATSGEALRLVVELGDRLAAHRVLEERLPQSGAAISRETVPLGGALLSLLPIQTPTDEGRRVRVLRRRRRSPYARDVAVSSFVVPVLRRGRSAPCRP